MFKYIKEYYEEGLYTEDNLKTLLAGGLLTQDEYNSLINPTPAP
ncbi:XkdX family protein [Pediococcus acidilactici]|nr:XkdX family protein [Pediococcus acidilactici]NVM32523.1 XkdX family protein [Pediococcus acidilactici]